MRSHVSRRPLRQSINLHLLDPRPSAGGPTCNLPSKPELGAPSQVVTQTDLVSGASIQVLAPCRLHHMLGQRRIITYTFVAVATSPDTKRLRHILDPDLARPVPPQLRKRGLGDIRKGPNDVVVPHHRQGRASPRPDETAGLLVLCALEMLACMDNGAHLFGPGCLSTGVTLHSCRGTVLDGQIKP